MTALPLLAASELFHWGALDGPSKPNASSSLEGCLLSCSQDEEIADAWREIAKLGGRDLWALTKPCGFSLLDIHALSAGQKKSLTASALSAGLIAPGVAYKSSYYDSEAGARRYSLHDTQTEAREQSFEESAARVQRLAVYRATPPLVRYWQSRHGGECIPLDLTLDASIACLLDRNHPDIDGLFWGDIFDPDGLSAPRAGIFQRSVAASSRKRLELD